jgi:hypothetical protein
MSRYKERTLRLQYSFPDAVWYRHSSYQIVGNDILPVRGATVEQYDPWEMYQEVAEKRRTVVTPYSALLEISRRLSPFRGDRRQEPVPPELLKEITRWCARWGYLGVLPSKLYQVNGAILQAEDSGTWEQRRHFRIGGWGEQRIEGGPPDRTYPRPGILVWQWWSRRYEQRELKEMASYFPAARGELRNFHYPEPNTEEFRHLYAEPLDEFIMMSLRFREAAEAVSRHLAGVSPLIEDMRAESEFVLNESMALLTSLEAGIGPLHRLEKGALFVRTEAVSLLSSFARMLFIDLARGRRVIRCGKKNCGRIFVSDEPRARYCSVRCRSVALNARYRQTQKRKQ